MPTRDFRALLQLSVKDFSLERLTGTVEAADALLRLEVLTKFDAHFKGAYCIVIHDPVVDSAVHAYLVSPGIANDSGKSILVLYEPVQRPIIGPGFAEAGIGEIARSGPMVDFVRGLLPGSAVVSPGILILSRLTEPGNPLYVPLGAATSDKDSAGAIRGVLAITASHVDGQSLVLDVDGVGRALARAGTAYQRASLRSAAELMLVALCALWDARRDLAAIIGGGIKMATGKRPGG